MNHKPSIEEVMLHYGTKRHSGRYKWGSGEDPYQHAGSPFLHEYTKLKAEGLEAKEIASRMGMNTTQLRNNITWARNEEEAYNSSQAHKFKEEGLSNTEIGKRLGVSEGTVRNYLSKESAPNKAKKVQFENVTNVVKSSLEKTGYLDVGTGVERQLGVSRTKFNAVVNKLVKDEGYYVHEVGIQRLNDPSKWTTVKVLTKEADIKVVRKDSDKIRHLDSSSDDNGMTMTRFYKPQMLNLDRIKVRYAEDGGADKDGLIEIRPGVKDLDLGRSRYAQVRIGAGENLYLKGMAAYSDAKFPDGVDIIFNTNKTKDTPKEQVLKKTKMHPNESDDPSLIFGSSVNKQKGALNIVNEEGDWDTWSKTLSSQFLSKQPTSLVKERLDATFDALKKDYDEINAMTNPVVKKHLMEKYHEGLDAKAKNLKAQGMPKTKSHVLLPFPDMNPNEIYAPHYKDGERVVLVRHPHGGKFEIPDLVVNNKHAGARKMLGSDAADAVGIHPSVAQKLSGADFDGDTALVIPNTQGKIKTERSLKELKNFDPMMYKVAEDSPVNIRVKNKETGEWENTGKTITDKYKQTQMGIVSNLITDMTIKDASNSELARAVKHSMVVIDSEKHRLDYKQSAIDNGISALVKRYQSHINPETGKPSKGASTLIARSKNKVDISQHETARQLHKDKVDKDGNIVKKGMSTEEIAVKLKISEKTVKEYIEKGAKFDPDKYSSGTAVEDLYSGHIKNIQKIKDDSARTIDSIKMPQYSKEAAKMYTKEIKSLDEKLNVALLNAPRERQAQIMTNNLYYAGVRPGMGKDDLKKLRDRSLATARTATGAKKTAIIITEKEWEAIQAKAISNTKLKQILDNADIDTVRRLAAPRELKLNTAKLTRANSYLSKGYTLSEISDILGVSTTTLRDELGLTKKKGVQDDE